MPSSILHTPQSDHALRRRQPGVMMEAPLPIPVAAGSASVNVPPAAICPGGAETINCTGILFPVIFCRRAVRVVGPGKAGALKLPPIPAAAFPASGEVFNSALPSEAFTLRSFFACQTWPMILLAVTVLAIAQSPTSTGGMPIEQFTLTAGGISRQPPRAPTVAFDLRPYSTNRRFEEDR